MFKLTVTAYTIIILILNFAVIHVVRVLSEQLSTAYTVDVLLGLLISYFLVISLLFLDALLIGVLITVFRGDR